MEVVNLKSENLRLMGKNLDEWVKDSNHVYISHDIGAFTKGELASKWNNPYDIKTYGREVALALYKDYVRYSQTKWNGKTLWESLDELRGKKLGCWCYPLPCHGDKLIELYEEKMSEIEHEHRICIMRSKVYRKIFQLLEDFMHEISTDNNIVWMSNKTRRRWETIIATMDTRDYKVFLDYVLENMEYEIPGIENFKNDIMYPACKACKEEIKRLEESRVPAIVLSAIYHYLITVVYYDYE